MSKPVLTPMRDSFPPWPLSQVWFPPCRPHDTISPRYGSILQNQAGEATAPPGPQLQSNLSQGWGCGEAGKGGERQGTRRAGWRKAALGWQLRPETQPALKGMLPNTHRFLSALLIFVSTKIPKSSSHIYPQWRGQEYLLLSLPPVRTQSVPGPSMLEAWAPQI